MTRNLSAFLRYCVNVQKFPDRRSPLTDLDDHIGTKLSFSKTQRVHSVTTQEIIDLIHSLKNDERAKRDIPAAYQEK